MSEYTTIRHCIYVDQNIDIQVILLYIMLTTPNDLDYYTIQLDERVTMSPKERRVLEFIRDHPKSLSGEIKDMLRSESWERYDEELEKHVHSWPHLELAKKGFIYSHNQGTARYWILTNPGKNFMSNLDALDKKITNNYSSAQKELDTFMSPSKMKAAISIMASIILKGKTEEEIQTKFEKLFEYGLPLPVLEMLKSAKRTNEGGVIRVTI